MSSAAAWLLPTSLTFQCTDIHTISFCRECGICETISPPMTPSMSPWPKHSMRHCSPATNVSPLRPATMRGSSWCKGPGLPAGHFTVAKRSPERRCANKKSARCALKKTAREEKAKTAKATVAFQSSKRQSEYQGYRGATPDRTSGSSMPILIGAAMIAAAILLSTLITAVGTRFAGMESPNDENLWLVDRLTGSVYNCHAPERGKAACDAEMATGSIGERAKR